MENKLKRLRNSMEKTKFNKLDFSDQLRKQINDKISKLKESEEDVYLAVFQLLLNKKSGYDLSQQLTARGILQFEESQGSLYTMLHRLEKNNYLLSNWDEKGVKYYQLNDKGRKILQKNEQEGKNKRFALKELLEG
ncbi:lineage-specific thermal regulator protein [Lottiidibacillus patelloidae]|uniref:Lineage-specific thermal regulator protein n=1 Tax=Lottiidibacillus patelloidae TaxID=2670334 RepID=A0A263BXU5_9BACI|nr:PadR family transcriptional regulator [Lottiidibacillus patelloidae]OZM58392.1 lineage-specific thermal regulator protein [Lottiidibacillus patelloidae]